MVGRIARAAALIAVALVGLGGTTFAQTGFARLSPAERKWVESIPESDRPIVNASGVFETRFVEARFSSAKAIFEDPEIVKVSLYHTARGGISSLADVQGIFPGRPAQFALAIAHLSHYDLLSYRTVFSADRSPSDSELAYHMQIQAISAGVLGIGETYLFVTNNYGERLPGGAYGFKWNLERSYKNTFRRIRGSWYIAPITYKGTQCTYLRYFNHSIFSHSPPIPLLILRRVTAEDYQELLTVAFHSVRSLRATKR